MSTGDLDVIRDDSVRVAVSRYLIAMTAFEGFEQKATDDFLSSLDELSRHVDLELLQLSLFSVTARDSKASTDGLFPFPAGPLRPQRLVDVQALVRDEEVHRILGRMNRAKTSMRLNRSRMRMASEKLLEQVEAALRLLDPR